MHDSPGVGQNYRDQRYMDMRFRLREARHSTNRDYSGARLTLNTLHYFLNRTGPMWRAADIVLEEQD